VAQQVLASAKQAAPALSSPATQSLWPHLGYGRPQHFLHQAQIASGEPFNCRAAPGGVARRMRTGVRSLIPIMRPVH
jgi:hypothetical protein